METVRKDPLAWHGGYCCASQLYRHEPSPSKPPYTLASSGELVFWRMLVSHLV